MQFFKVIAKALDKLGQLTRLVLVGDFILLAGGYMLGIKFGWGIVGVFTGFVVAASLKAVGMLRILSKIDFENEL